MPLNLTIKKMNNFFLILYGEISVLIGPIPRLFVTDALLVQCTRIANQQYSRAQNACCMFRVSIDTIQRKSDFCCTGIVHREFSLLKKTWPNLICILFINLLLHLFCNGFLKPVWNYESFGAHEAEL